MVRWAALFCVCASSSFAGVREDVADATRLLKTAQEEAALAVLSRGLDRPNLKTAERAELYTLLGIARVNLRDDEGAALAFQRAAEAESSVALPLRLASPHARELFEDAKARVAVAQRAEPSPVVDSKPKAQASVEPEAVVAAPEPSPAGPKAASRIRLSSYGVLALAALSVGVGVFFGAQSSAAFGQISSAPRDNMGRILLLGEANATALNASGAQSAMIADALFGAAGALFIVAVVLWLVGGS